MVWKCTKKKKKKVDQRVEIKNKKQIPKSC